MKIGDYVKIVDPDKVYTGDDRIANKLKAKNWQKGKDLPSKKYNYGYIMAIDRNSQIARVSIKHEDYLIDMSALRSLAYRKTQFDF